MIQMALYHIEGVALAKNFIKARLFKNEFQRESSIPKVSKCGYFERYHENHCRFQRKMKSLQFLIKGAVFSKTFIKLICHKIEFQRESSIPKVSKCGYFEGYHDNHCRFQRKIKSVQFLIKGVVFSKTFIILTGNKIEFQVKSLL